MVVSSRKQNNVDEAVKTLKSEGLQVSGIVCHVGKDEDRKRLINKVMQTATADTCMMYFYMNRHIPLYSLVCKLRTFPSP